MNTRKLSPGEQLILDSFREWHDQGRDYAPSVDKFVEKAIEYAEALRAAGYKSRHLPSIKVALKQLTRQSRSSWPTVRVMIETIKQQRRAESMLESARQVNEHVERASHDVVIEHVAKWKKQFERECG